MHFVLSAIHDIAQLSHSNHFAKPVKSSSFRLVLSGASCLGIGLIPFNLPNTGGVYAGRLILLLLGKFGASSAFATLYVFTR